MSFAARDLSDPLPTPTLMRGVRFFGNILQFLRDPRDYFIDCSRRYGPVFRVDTPKGFVTIVCGRACEELLDDESGSGLTRKGLFRAFSTEVGVEIFEMQGEEHRRTRERTTLPYSRHITAQFVPEMEAAVRDRVQDLRPDAEIELRDFCVRTTLHSMMGVVSPIELRGITDCFLSYGDRVMNVIVQKMPHAALRTPLYRRHKSRVHQAIDEIIARHAQGDFANLERMYMADAAIKSFGDPADPHLAEAIRGALIYALEGSVVYTSRLVFFLLFEILKSPPLRERIEAEVDEAFGGGPIDSALFRKMPYLRSAYLETLRMFPLLPGLPFRAEKDIVFRGVRIPAGEDLIFVPHAEHFDEANFKDAYRFNAERFHVSKKERFPRGAFFPFGISKRRCSAVGSSEIMVMTIICSLLNGRSWQLRAASQSYRLRLAPLIGPDRDIDVVYRGGRERKESRAAFLSEAFDFESPVETCGVDKSLPDGVSTSYARGDVIMREGDQPDAFYMITGGRVSVEKAGKVVAELEEGQGFGELGLLKDIPRTATIRVQSERAHFIKLTADQFLDMVLDLDVEGRELPSVLARHFLSQNVKNALPSIRPARLEVLLEEHRFRNFEAGEVVIRQGERAESFYVILAGSVDVDVNKNGVMTRVATLRAGDIFGELGVISGSPRNASVVAAESLTVMESPRDVLTGLLEGSANLQDDVYTLVLRRLNKNLAEST